MLATARLGETGAENDVKNYIIVANGGAEDSIEVLGEAYQTTFPTRADAEAVLAQIREDAPDYGFGDVVYEIREASHVEVRVRANPDEDDCLAAAEAAYIAARPKLRGWDLSPRWGEDARETVVLTVPAWAAEGGAS